jgi:hypothetical protein
MGTAGESMAKLDSESTGRKDDDYAAIKKILSCLAFLIESGNPRETRRSLWLYV